jgi:hypothetical protein
MRSALKCVLLAASVVVLLAPTADSRTYRDCGTIRFSGRATRVARTYDRRFQAPKPWQCGLAHAPFRKINGRKVGFSCGYGTGGANLASRAHAFVGTL